MLFPYQQCVVDEHIAIQGKADELSLFTYTENFKALPVEEQVRLRLQHTFMEAYADVLCDRINHFIAQE